MPLTDQVSIRTAIRTDLPSVVALYRDDEQHARPETDLHAPEGRYVDAFAAIEADPNNTLYVAEVEGRVVGTFQLTLIPYVMYQGCWVANVEAVHVHSSRRGRGIGTSMLRFAIAEARRRGCLRVQLTTNLARPGAARLYERLGFEHSHRGFKLYLD